MNNTRTFLALATLVAALVIWFSPSTQAARVYFTDQPAGAPGYVMSVSPDGTGQATVLTASNSPDLRGIAFHRASARVYFLDNGTAKKIYSVLPNGSDLQEIVSISSGLNADLEIDEAAGKLYWADNEAALIRRANLNGTGAETAVATAVGLTTAPYFIHLDPVGGYIYWGVLSSGSGPSSFRRATFAGVTDSGFLITTTSRTRDIAIDPGTSTAYWNDRQTGIVFKRTLSGGANQTVIGGMNAPHGIELDVEAGKVYWADTGARGTPPSGLSPRRVARCNLDGTEFENISTPLATSEPWDLALDLRSPTYADWRARFFSVGMTNAVPDGDADGDGARNLMEYAMGTNPRKFSSVPRIALQGTDIRFTRRAGSELTYRVEVSTNLPTFHYNGDGTALVWTTELSATPIADELESVVVAVGPALVGASNVFFRVAASLP